MIVDSIRRFTMRTFLLHRAAWPRCGGVRRALTGREENGHGGVYYRPCNPGGALAGPRVLEHLWIRCCIFEESAPRTYGFCRAQKPFWLPDEIGVFEIRDMGMMELKNPTMLFEADFGQDLDGGYRFRSCARNEGPCS